MQYSKHHKRYLLVVFLQLWMNMGNSRWQNLLWIKCLQNLSCLLLPPKQYQSWHFLLVPNPWNNILFSCSIEKSNSRIVNNMLHTLNSTWLRPVPITWMTSFITSEYLTMKIWALIPIFSLISSNNEYVSFELMYITQML